MLLLVVLGESYAILKNRSCTSLETLSISIGVNAQALCACILSINCPKNKKKTII